ncbi:thioredoxin family protein [Wenzhouxiangella marina]|uniref:Uncharacterized protein n=1 Tax=Wenzhouxiangella marina TaxID=1579979 RepID=A0A0K0XZD5_9GAMM|nr:thioredoxin family protein [Wenzhouxiangella marina]AKS43053.1 hypothetical protein WM2015_2695 [Wenzhouxiangella marina]MBB6087263.1 thioredoxin 1 [Wenzhouxiangella marina]
MIKKAFLLALLLSSFSVAQAQGLQRVDDNSFDELVGNPGVSVVLVTGHQTGPYRQMQSEVAAMASRYRGSVRFFSLDADSSPSTASRLGVRSLPVVLFFSNGGLIIQQLGEVPMDVIEGQLQALLP